MRSLLRALILLPLSTSAVAQSSQIIYWSIPQDQIENAIQHVPQDNPSRLARLRSRFEDGECKGSFMHDQIVRHKQNVEGKNLICNLNEDSGRGTILIIAHYQHEGAGMSVVDNWSGALMLPLLYFSLRVAPRTHRYVFLELDGKEGAKTYLHFLSREQRHAVKAVIALDGLGVGNLSYFSIPNFGEPIQPASIGLQMAFLQSAFFNGMKPLPALSDPRHWVGLDDTAEFRHAKLPVLTIHSIADQYKLPRSKDDTPAAIDMDKYYQTYRVLCVYLGYLDTVADTLTAYNNISHSKGHR